VGMRGIRLIQEECVRVVLRSGRPRSVIAAMVGRRIRIGTNMSEVIELKIEGMHCDGCVRRVSALLRKVEGVAVEEVVVGAAKVKLGEAGATRAELVRAVEGGGFQVAG
jgi:copper chaperone